MHTVHAKNMTPHIAIAVYGSIIVGVAIVLHAFGWTSLTIFDDAGTLAAFGFLLAYFTISVGFLLAYFTISVAAPVYLRRIGELLPRNVLVAVAAFACLLVPTVGSFYPAPPWPLNLFPYLFLAYMLVGGGWLYAINRKQPGTLLAIQASLEETLDASAHEIAQSEEQHRRPTVDLGGQHISPAPAG
jgi:amino acid transporter